MKTKSVTLYISYDGYMQPSGVNIITGKTLLSALKKTMNQHCYGITGKTPDKILQKMDDVGGDGCDYIISIIQDNGTLIYRCDE